MDKRFIEESFPLKEISYLAAKEKSIKHSHISTMHIWWSRKPLASSRATIFASLIPFSQDVVKWNKTRQFIIDFSKWENISNKNYINQARKDILEFIKDKPRILDPFSGGGSIPLEALKLGCDTYSSDYNPVAVLIQKCILEYPQKYRLKLIEDLEYWSKWVLNLVKDDIGKFFNLEIKETSGFFGKSTEEKIPIGYIWARTINCDNPNCETEIPLLTQYWLVKKKAKKIFLYPYKKDKKILFKIINDKTIEDFDPSKGSIRRAFAKCPSCSSAQKPDEIRKKFQQGKSKQKIIAIVYKIAGKRGKYYKIPSSKEINTSIEAEKYFHVKNKKLREEWGIEPVPDEELVRVPFKVGCINVWVYGINTWGDLFNSRQKLVLITFIEKIKQAYKEMLNLKYDYEYAKCILTYLAICVDRLADYNSTQCLWHNSKEIISHTYGRQAIPMIWTYIETNPFSGSSGSWEIGWKNYIDVINHCKQNTKTPAKITQCSATDLPFENDFFDAVFTDPPYYDNIPYSYLSDFFYVWLKRSIGDLYPELFSTPKTPKSKEIVAYTIDDNWEDGKNNFEQLLMQSFKEICRVLKPNGIAIIIYAHKTLDGWETVINSLLASGLNISASWPLSSEMKERLRAQKSAVLSSSIYIVARKIKKKELGFYQEINKELKNYLNTKLERLWQEGISGADFLISAIGIGIEIFGQYEKIIDFEGNTIKGDKILESVRGYVIDFAIKQILDVNYLKELSSLTKFYVLWRWNFHEAKVKFDEAKKIANSIGISLEEEWNDGFIMKEREYVNVVGPQVRKIGELEDSHELIDILHYILLLWEKNENDRIIEKLSKFSKENEILYRVAHAISQCLSNESKEKQLIDGFLSGKERIKENIKESKQLKKIDGEWK